MASISMKELTLTYELYHDRSLTLKERTLNFIHRRKFTEKRVQKIRALDHFSLEVKDEDRIGIIGHNGAGKSTLLKVIAGILKPQQGELKVDGHIQPLIEVGAGFNPELSGRDNIYLNSYMLGFTKHQVEAREKEIITFSELEEFIDVPVKYYSTGMSVRLAFTIATMIEPEILLLDEMLSAGDAKFIDKAKKRLDGLVSKSRILVFVSHDLEMIEALCNRVLVLERGKIVHDGTSKSAIKYYIDGPF